jgi:hypothetical protein
MMIILLWLQLLPFLIELLHMRHQLQIDKQLAEEAAACIPVELRTQLHHVSIRVSANDQHDCDCRYPNQKRRGLEFLAFLIIPSLLRKHMLHFQRVPCSIN